MRLPDKIMSEPVLKTDHYELTCSQEAATLRAELSGYWSLGVIETYARDLNAAFIRFRLGLPSGTCIRVLINRLRQDVLPQDAVAAGQAVIASMLNGARVAVVVPSVISKRQADRMRPDGSAFFFDLVAAETWLAGNDPPPPQKRGDHGVINDKPSTVGSSPRSNPLGYEHREAPASEVPGNAIGLGRGRTAALTGDTWRNR